MRIKELIEKIRGIADKVEVGVKLLQWVVDSLRNLPKL